MKEICTLLVKFHIICSRMQRVNLHARRSITPVGCPTCCHQVCALDHAKGCTADLDYCSGVRPTNDISIEFEIRPKFALLWINTHSVTLSWRVQDFVAIGEAYLKLEHSKIWSNFEFDRIIFSGTGTRALPS